MSSYFWIYGLLLCLGIKQGGAQTQTAPALTDQDSLCIAFYNVENLFDTIDNPLTDDAEYLPDKGWTQEKYHHKLLQLSRVIDTLGGSKGPDILGLCEVENRLVLEDLIQTPLLEDDAYDIAHFESADPRGIDVALLYRKEKFQILEQHAFRLFMPDTQLVRTRDVLWVLATFANRDTLGIFVCHWPSRLGGQRAERYRFYIGQRIQEITDSLKILYPGTLWILMGDFNDEPSDTSISLGLEAQSDYEKACSIGKFFNPFAALELKGDGTHAYQQTWHVLDQIMVKNCFSPEQNKLKYLPESASVFRPLWIQNRNPKYFGEPYRTKAGKTYLGGYSDHFPVYLYLYRP